MTAPTTRADHAELLRRALQDAQELSRRGLNPDVRLNAAEREAVTHILSEIAALRAVDEEGEVLRQAQRARATQAERQRDELRKALERIAHTPDGEDGLPLTECVNIARQALANHGADQ